MYGYGRNTVHGFRSFDIFLIYEKEEKNILTDLIGKKNSYLIRHSAV